MRLGAEPGHAVDLSPAFRRPAAAGLDRHRAHTYLCGFGIRPAQEIHVCAWPSHFTAGAEHITHGPEGRARKAALPRFPPRHVIYPISDPYYPQKKKQQPARANRSAIRTEPAGKSGPEPCVMLETMPETQDAAAPSHPRSPRPEPREPAADAGNARCGNARRRPMLGLRLGTRSCPGRP